MKQLHFETIGRPVVLRSSVSPSGLIENTDFDGNTPFVLIEKYFKNDDITIPHYGKTVEIIINIGCEGSFRVDDVTHELKKCTLLYIPPNHIHSNNIRSCGGRQLILKIPTEKNDIFLDFERLLNIDGCTLFCNPFILEISEGAVECADEIIRNSGDILFCIEQLLKLFRLLRYKMSKQDNGSRGLGTNQSETLKKLIDFTEAHFTGHISNSCAANHIGYDVVYFCRWFKRQVGMTYNEYLMLLRIRYACRLLESGIGVTEVIGMLGYSNLSFFGRKFKSHIGCTPKEYQIRFVSLEKGRHR